MVGKKQVEERLPFFFPLSSRWADDITTLVEFTTVFNYFDFHKLGNDKLTTIHLSGGG